MEELTNDRRYDYGDFFCELGNANSVTFRKKPMNEEIKAQQFIDSLEKQ